MLKRAAGAVIWTVLAIALLLEKRRKRREQAP